MGMLSVHVWGWSGGRHLGEVGIGGGIRDWNVEFILLGAQLFILISPVSCCICLILGLNPGSTSFSVAELGKADTVGYSSAPCSHHHSSSLLQAAKRDKEKAGPPKKHLPHTADPHPLCRYPSTGNRVPSTGNRVLKASHLTSKPTPKCHDNLS